MLRQTVVRTLVRNAKSTRVTPVLRSSIVASWSAQPVRTFSSNVVKRSATAAHENPVDLNLLKESHPTPKEADSEPRFPPPARLFDGSVPKPYINKADYERMYKESIQDPEKFWGDRAKELVEWSTPFKAVRHGTPEEGDFSWFLGGELNACYNMVDRHALKNPDKTALIWESDEPGEHEYISFGTVLAEVSKLANLYKSYGLQKGDTVAIYMPMVPEAIYAMLACSRLGLVHCVVFAGFSSDALRDRIQDSKAKIVMTSDQSKRGGKVHDLKATVDRALLECPTVEKVIVHRRTGEFNVPMLKDRDVWYHEQVPNQRPYCPPVNMHPEDPLFILYTSGSTGKPKGLVHTTGGYLVQTATSFKYIFDVHPDKDIWASMADIGWITGHTYNLYGPLTMGATSLIFESIPTYPDAGRFWQCVETHKITQLYTAPTAIRLLRKFGDSYVNKYDLSSLRVLGSVGEPINPEAWMWYYQVPGRSQCAIVDTYWQTETGSIIMTPLPGVHDMKPGSCTAPFFGIEPAIVEATTGAEIQGNDVGGVLALKLQRGAWPSVARTCLNDHKRYMDTYLNVYKGMYFTGDGATRDKDGYYWIRGRVDDVINVSGHRISTAEVESALVQHPAVAESAVVAVPDELTGEALAVFVTAKEEDSFPLAPSHENEAGHQLRKDALKKALIKHVRESVGPFAAPKKMYIVPDLPKTRSGKIMRRILRKIASGEVKDEAGISTLGDLSTLSDPGLIPSLIKIVHDIPDLQVKTTDHV